MGVVWGGGCAFCASFTKRNFRETKTKEKQKKKKHAKTKEKQKTFLNLFFWRAVYYYGSSPH
jgi:radical SAM superfamily enzyme